MVYDDPLYWEVQFSPFKEHAMPLVSEIDTSTEILNMILILLLDSVIIYK